MKSVEFLIGEFKDGRLMFLFLFKDGPNFRIHREANLTYYTWCPTDDDLKAALKIYEAVNRFNLEFKRKKINGRRAEEEHKRSLDVKRSRMSFYI